MLINVIEAVRLWIADRTIIANSLFHYDRGTCNHLHFPDFSGTSNTPKRSLSYVLHLDFPKLLFLKSSFSKFRLCTDPLRTLATILATSTFKNIHKWFMSVY